jgi:hypothetical protein
MDVTIAPGADLFLDTVVTNPDGTVRDVSGATGSFPIYDQPYGLQVLAGDMSITDGAAGQVSFTLDSADTADYAGEFHVWFGELWLSETNGVDSRLDTVKLTLS